jgi:hypothetical protein
LTIATHELAWRSSGDWCTRRFHCSHDTRIASFSNSFGYRIAFSYAGGLNSNG